MKVLTLLFMEDAPLLMDVSISNTVYSMSCLVPHKLLNGLLQYALADTSVTWQKTKKNVTRILSISGNVGVGARGNVPP